MMKNIYVKISIALIMLVSVICSSSAYADNLNEISNGLIKYKQAIYNNVYGFDGGTATSLKVLDIEDGFAKVEIQWRGWIHEGTSIIGVKWDNNNVVCYEIAIHYKTNQDNVDTAKGIGVAAAAGLTIISLFDALSSE